MLQGDSESACYLLSVVLVMMEMVEGIDKGGSINMAMHAVLLKNILSILSQMYSFCFVVVPLTTNSV